MRGLYILQHMIKMKRVFAEMLRLHSREYMFCHGSVLEAIDSMDLTKRRYNKKLLNEKKLDFKVKQKKKKSWWYFF